MCAGRSRVRLIVWTHGEHVDADPRQVLPFYLERFGRQVEEQAFRGYRIVTYDLDSADVDFRVPLEFHALAPVSPGGEPATFGSQLVLPAASHETAVPAGEAAWVALQWDVLRAPAADYKVSLRLRDVEGQLAGQADVWLLSNEHLLASRWTPGMAVTSYHLISIPPETAPGGYQLSLVVYEPESLTALPLVDQAGTAVGQEAPLGTIEIGPAR
jgi:hypothetical protein